MNEEDGEGGTLKYGKNKKEGVNGAPSLSPSARRRGGWNEDGMAAATDTPRVVKSIPWF